MLDDLLQPLAQEFSGALSVAFYDFRTGARYLYQAEATMRAASLIKLPLLVLALERASAGALSLRARYPLRAEDQVGGAGVLQALAPGLALTLEDLLTLMIIVSDNTATNMVIDILGEATINPALQALGLRQTRLVGKLQLPLVQQNAAQRRGEANATSALDMLGLLLRLDQGELLAPEYTALARSILSKQQYTEALSRYLPRDAELDAPHVVVASKSGCLRGLWHDAGIVYNASGAPLYVLVVMTDGARDRSYSFEQEGMMLIAQLSRAVFDRVKD
jgi:beta-lactamase class A